MPLTRRDTARPKPPPTAPGDLIAALGSGSPDARASAARDLATAPGGVGALARALASEADPRVREAIFTGLARAATPASVEAVAPYLRSDDAQVRAAALDALRAMPLAVRPRLPDLLADDDADVRLLACEIVRDLPGGAATELLDALLEREGEPNVCAAALDVLAEIGGAAALPVLARCAERFRGEAFLAFAIRIAADRIAASADR